MIELVTLEQAKAHLRIDDDYGDADLKLKIQGGSSAILAYIQGSRALIVGEDGSVIQNTEALTRVQNRASSSVWGMTFTASRCWATRPVSVMTTASSADMETGTIST